MKKLISVSSLAFIWTIISVQVTYAMCIWFVPPGRAFEPADEIRALWVQRDNQTKLVVQPQWRGTATDFALVMPFAEEPQINQASSSIFDELEDLTNPVIEQPVSEANSLFSGAEDGTSDGREVEVIERRDIGSYQATTLKADDSESLTNWLNTNNYQLSDQKLETLEYYIEDLGGYFVALKVNTESAKIDTNGFLTAELEPLEFSYESRDVRIPLRLMAGDSDIIELVLYTLSEDELYLPGAAIQFARKLSSKNLSDAPSLRDYNARSLWLVRSAISFDPGAVEKDAEFIKLPETVQVDPGDDAIRINPDLLDETTGLVESDTSVVRYVEERQQSVDEVTRNNTVLAWLTAILAVSNLVLLSMLLRTKSTKKP